MPCVIVPLNQEDLGIQGAARLLRSYLCLKAISVLNFIVSLVRIFLLCSHHNFYWRRHGKSLVNRKRFGCFCVTQATTDTKVFVAWINLCIVGNRETFHPTLNWSLPASSCHLQFANSWLWHRPWFSIVLRFMSGRIWYGNCNYLNTPLKLVVGLIGTCILSV